MGKDAKSLNRQKGESAPERKNPRSATTCQKGHGKGGEDLEMTTWKEKKQRGGLASTTIVPEAMDHAELTSHKKKIS